MVGMTDWPMHRIWHLLVVRIRKVLKILAIAGLDASEHISDIHHVGFPDEEYIPVSGEEHKVHWLINKLFPYILLKILSTGKFTLITLKRPVKVIKI